MSKTTTTELTSQYSTQVSGDLERNLKEQERVSGEIEALKAQLTALQQDHTVLVNVQQVLGLPAAPTQTAPEARTVPAPREEKAAAVPRARRRTRAGKSAAPAQRNVGKKSTAAAQTVQSAAPKLVDLVRDHLAGQHEPRSAAEIATTLEQQHPEREIKAKIVRVTLERLVAKNHARRTRQGHSIFYTTPEAFEPPSQDEPATSEA
ncbi:hypothetical protein ABZZ74_51320 [Streptomyces sp. NPDC006476]|uniref:hypothetical protein n=1 Tax=Streptomyces sp. NPDC006476 TaxID=3157175 RepID=UPI0033BDEA7D